MKKNLVLYILLLFLIVVNGFFLYNYTGSKPVAKPDRPQPPNTFIVKELGFNDVQLAEFRKRSQSHDKSMRRVSEAITDLKETLFAQLLDAAAKKNEVDSITFLLGEKEKEKQALIFYYFKSIQTICDDAQKQKFRSIIKDALQEPGTGNQQLPGLEKGPERRKEPPRRD